MNWNSVLNTRPPSNVRLWVLTDTGNQVQAYYTMGGEWVILCPRVARLNPTVIKWSDDL